MTSSDNLSAIEKALEGGHWAASVHDCRPPHSRRDHPRKHSRVITLPEKFLTEQEAMEAGADAIASGWAGSTIIHRESATHKALFELDRYRVTELVRALPTLLAEARKAEAMKLALKTPFCVLYLDGRNEQGTHVLPSYPRSFEVVDEDVAEQAEAILEAAENAGFQIGQYVWAEFAWIAPQIGDEGRVELDGYWDFRWVNEPMSTLLNGASDD